MDTDRSIPPPLFWSLESDQNYHFEKCPVRNIIIQDIPLKTSFLGIRGISTSICPITFLQFNWPTSNIFSIHLSQCLEKVLRLTKCNESIPLGFAALPIPDDSDSS
jgi:hypothetical protein